MKILKINIFAFVLLFSFQTLEARDDIFGLINKKIDFLNERDALIAQNIANSDTPNYKPLDIEDKKQYPSSISLETTNPMHISANEHGSSYKRVESKVQSLKPSGNAVNTQYEIFQKKQNSTKIEEIAGIYTKAKGIILKSMSGE